MEYPLTKWKSLIALVGLAGFLGLEVREVRAEIDLHAHLWMEHSVPSLMYEGCFDCRLGAKNWAGIRGSRVNHEALERSGLKLVVVAFYANPLSPGGSSRGAIRKQIRAAQEWLKGNSQWVQARSACDARHALEQGKRVVVFSLEGAGGILETEGDLQEFVDQAGIAIVTPMHFLDNHWGGCAFLHGAPGWWFNPWARVRAWWQGHSSNSQGLTEQGAEKLRALIARKVWVDLSHASDETQKQMRPWLETAGQPPLYTHTSLRKYHGAERGLSDEQLDDLARRKGIVGLMPSRLMIGQVPRESRVRPESCPATTGVDGFAAHYRDTVQKIGMGAVMLGSDFNAPIEYLEPGGGAGCQTGTALDRPEGFWQMGQVAELWKAVQSVSQGGSLSAQGALESGLRLNRFLDAWEQAKACSSL